MNYEELKVFYKDINNIKDTSNLNNNELSLYNFYNFHNKIKETMEKEMNNYNNLFIEEKDNNIIKELIEIFKDLNSGGKYIRALLIALAYNNYIEDNKYIPLAVAYETFQTSVLMHDDITDKADTRRGKETIHKRLRTKYKSIENIQDTIDISNSLGMWTGNLGYFLTNNIILDNYKDNSNLNIILKEYNNIVINTIKGEIIDVDLPFESIYLDYKTKEEDILDIYRLKTADYTIVGPYKLGLSILGKSLNKTLEKALENIGIAFQIKDDILGIFGDSKVMGKPNTSDIEEYKQTILYSYVLNTKYKDELLKYYGKPITEEELEKVRDIMIKSNALEYSNNKIDELFKESLEIIEKEDLNENTKSILKGLIIYINLRNK